MAEKDLQPLLDTQQNQLSVSLSANDSIDNRALGIVASVVAVLIFIGQAPFVLDVWLWIALLVPYAVSLVYAIVCLRPRFGPGASVNLEEHPEYLTMQKDALVAQLLADTRLAIVGIAMQNAYKKKLLRRSFIWAICGVLVLLVVLAVK
jgi:hypothetical protein